MNRFQQEPHQQTESSSQRLSLRTQVAWGAASLGTLTLSGIYGSLLPIFYQDYKGLQPGWIALAALIYAIWNAINDPLFGYISDRTRSRLGRRIPYIRFTAPFLALAFILLWLPPFQAGQRAVFGWMLATMLLFDTAYTIVGLSYNALLPELSESESERHRMQIFASLFGLTGVLLGFLIPDLFRPKHGVGGSLLPVQLALVVVAVACMTVILLMTFHVKERLEFSVVDRALGFWDSLRYTFTSRAFLVLAASYFLTNLMTAMVVGAIFYLADYLAKVNALVLVACLYIPLLAGIPLTTPIRTRFGVARTLQVMLAVTGSGLVLIAVVPPVLIPACLAIAGFGMAGPQTLTNLLFAQVADEDEVRSGVRREGMFFGVNALLTKPAQSFALALPSFILQVTGFVTREQNQGSLFIDQSAQALFGVEVIAGLIPGVAIFLGALILFAYPLHGKYLKEVESQVLEMHARKHAQLEP